MENNMVSQVLSVVNRIDPNLSDVIEVGMEYVPYIGKVLQIRKFNRFERRLIEHSSKLKNISSLMADSRLVAEFIQERVAPIVISDLIEEHEDSKINLILNGFENVFIEENSDESIILSYFDTLRSLRYADLRRLFYVANRSTSYRLPIIESDEHALIRHSDNKLINLGLLSVQVTFDGLGGREKDLNKDNVVMHLYGKKFLEFITERK